MKILETVIKFLGKLLAIKSKTKTPKNLVLHDIQFIWKSGKLLAADDLEHWEVAMLAHSFIKVYPPTKTCPHWKTIEGDYQPIAYFEGSEKEAFATAVVWAKTNYRLILKYS